MSLSRTLRRGVAALALAPAIALTTDTPAAAQQAETASLDASKRTVKTGERVALEGSFPVAQKSGGGEQPNQNGKVRIEFQRADASSWKTVGKTKVRKDGGFREKVKVELTGRYRAVAPDGSVTAPERIRAKSKTKARVRGADVKPGDRVKIKGRVIPKTGARKVTVKVGGDRINTRTRNNGTFTVKWKASGTGSSKVRVKAKGDALAAGSSDRAGKVTVFRPAQASWYGPGFYGNRTACGQTLTTGMEGVAHKTMPCGTKLKLHYKGKTVPVTVIDRGPYHGNREFDLTSATKKRLGFGDTGTVWASR